MCAVVCACLRAYSATRSVRVYVCMPAACACVCLHVRVCVIACVCDVRACVCVCVTVRVWNRCIAPLLL